ncbi:Seprase [Orbilia brochopaga]|nr:Seprase [Drechslerella brochopaga]
MKLSAAVVLSLGLLAAAVDPPRKPRQPVGSGSKILTYNETVARPSFSVQRTSIDWFAGGEDGTGLRLSKAGDIVLENFITGNSSVFLPAKLIPKDYTDYWIRPDLKRVLFAVNHTKQYRHSYFANYLILDVAAGTTTPIVADQAGDIQYAEFAPAGDAIAFVRGNNLFVNVNGAVTQITKDGGPDLFHAIPDWVYEEEIFSDRKTLWWSPDGKFLAYLSFDETGVPTYRVPYYMDSQTIAPPYPRELELRYPKVGATNPTVSFTLLDATSFKTTPVPITAFAKDDTIIGEVAWLTDDHAKVVARAFNRVQDQEKLVLVSVPEGRAKVVRQRDGSDGWLDNNIAITYVGPVSRRRTRTTKTNYYVDMSDHTGWNHLYLYPVDGGAAVPLTSGQWEVTAILYVDTKRQLIYFQSTKQHSTSRHIYSVSYKTNKITALVDDSVSASYSASFSAGGGYYLLSYNGPDVPYQELYASNTTHPTAIRTVTDNRALYDKLQEYQLPQITYIDLPHPDGWTLNVMQRLPAKFDPSKKYPILFIPYGGPGAQQVSQSFSSLNWNAYIASDPELEFITWTVDGRGTGYKGRKFRSAVTGQLGKFEAADQIFAAREAIRMHKFVDADKVGIWGWSFGGYLSAKVLEADSGVFNFAFIIAPVSDFRFYDSMYTERYMKTYAQNAAGYNTTAVRHSAGFKNIKGSFSILHGTGDDNVHYQNSASLVNLLVRESVPPSKMHMFAFTDSDHGISYDGAYPWLYKYLTERLFVEKKRVVEEQGMGLVHQWSKKSLVGKTAV